MNKSIIKVILVAIPLLAFVPAMAQFDNAFQSTSTMAGSGSAYASDPTLGADGTATYDATLNRGRGIGGNDTGGGQGGGGDTKPDPLNDPDGPIGPALPALLLLAGAYTAIIALRRRKQA